MKKTKVRTTLLIDKEVIEKAKELGLNLSKVCENCLKQYIKALESVRMTNGGEKAEGSAETLKKVFASGPGGFHTYLGTNPSTCINNCIGSSDLFLYTE